MRVRIWTPRKVQARTLRHRGGGGLFVMGRIWAGRWGESCRGQGAVAWSGRVEGWVAGRAQLVIKTSHVQGGRLDWSWVG